MYVLTVQRNDPVVLPACGHGAAARQLDIELAQGAVDRAVRDGGGHRLVKGEIPAQVQGVGFFVERAAGKAGDAVLVLHRHLHAVDPEFTGLDVIRHQRARLDRDAEGAGIAAVHDGDGRPFGAAHAAAGRRYKHFIVCKLDRALCKERPAVGRRARLTDRCQLGDAVRAAGNVADGDRIRVRAAAIAVRADAGVLTDRGGALPGIRVGAKALGADLGVADVDARHAHTVLAAREIGGRAARRLVKIHDAGLANERGAAAVNIQGAAAGDMEIPVIRLDAVRGVRGRADLIDARDVDRQGAPGVIVDDRRGLGAARHVGVVQIQRRRGLVVGDRPVAQHVLAVVARHLQAADPEVVFDGFRACGEAQAGQTAQHHHQRQKQAQSAFHSLHRGFLLIEVS